MNLACLTETGVHPGIAHLARYCAELAGEDPLPRRRQFWPSRVADVITYLFVVDLLPGEDDYYVSLFGSRITILFGMDCSKKRFSEISDEFVRGELRRTYDEVAASGKPLYLRGRYEWPELSIGIERLLVPMIDDGGTVTSIIGLSIPDVSEDVLPFFAGQGPARLIVDRVLTLQ